MSVACPCPALRRRKSDFRVMPLPLNTQYGGDGLKARFIIDRVKAELFKNPINGAIMVRRND
jgi:hypothetical protein